MRKLLWVLLILFSAQLQAPELTPITKAESMERALAEYNRQAFLSSLDTMSFSIDNMYKALLYLEVKQPEMLIRQAYLETGGFTSELWINYNNPFGMKHGWKRPNKSYGRVMEPVGYAGYTHWSDAVRDMKLFQQYWEQYGWDLDNAYEVFLVKLPYATDKHYIRKLNSLNIELNT